jgi:cytochrome b561
MSATNHHDENVNIHGIHGASNKGYCMLYFFMFLLLFIGAVYMTIHGNMSGLPEPK